MFKHELNRSVLRYRPFEEVHGEKSSKKNQVYLQVSRLRLFFLTSLVQIEMLMFGRRKNKEIKDSKGLKNPRRMLEHVFSFF